MTKAKEVRLFKNMSGFAAKAHVRMATRIPREITPPNSIKTETSTPRFFDVAWENQLPLRLSEGFLARSRHARIGRGLRAVAQFSARLRILSVSVAGAFACVASASTRAATSRRIISSTRIHSLTRFAIFTRLLRRPSQQKQHRDFQTEKGLTTPRSGDNAQARKKGGLKFLYRICYRGKHGHLSREHLKQLNGGSMMRSTAALLAAAMIFSASAFADCQWTSITRSRRSPTKRRTTRSKRARKRTSTSRRLSAARTTRRCAGRRSSML